MSLNQANDKPVAKSVSSYSTFSSSSNKSTTVIKDGKPVTTSASIQSSSSSTNGEGFPTLEGFPQGFGSSSATGFLDDFEKLKMSVLSGDAYKRSERIHSDITAQRGQPHFKPQQGETTIRPTRTFSSSSSASSSGYSSVSGGAAGLSPGSQASSAPLSPASMASDASSATTAGTPRSTTTPIKMSHNYKTELFIPVRRHQGDFDDFFRNRWLEQNQSTMDTEFDRRRTEWESRLDAMKGNFFHFSPFGDQPAHIDSQRTLQPQSSSITVGPTGNPEFAVRFDVKDFKPEEINVSTCGGKLTISAVHEEKTGNSTSRREFKRTVDVPSDVQIGLMRSTLSKDGILSITAPINPPNYLPPSHSHQQQANHALQSSSQVTQQHATALNSMPMPTASSVVSRGPDTAESLNYTLSIAGYQPEEVTVTVEGRKVVVRAKHDESTGGRKVHNEMTKSFDLPPSVDANNVRSYIKDGTTLYIEAHLRDDLVGKIHLVPVTHK